MATTRWIDNQEKDFIEIINKILSVKEDRERYANIQTSQYFAENQTATFGGRVITFNYISFTFDFIRPGEEPIEDRTTHNNCFIIVYDNGANVNYIINRNYDAKKLLRLLVGYTGQNEIGENNINIEGDLFVWLISKVFKSENSLSIESEADGSDRDIYIDSIKGFKGDSEDNLTKVSADGRSVMNIISTLSFLLESSLLNQIKMDINYKNHDNIELILSVKKTISTSLKEYDGDYDGNTTQEITSYLYLLIYLEIIPNLKQRYQLEFDSEQWGIPQYKEFLMSVAEKLQANVSTKVTAIDERDDVLV